MIITVSLNPALDKAVTVDGLAVNGVNRVLSSRIDAGGKGINVAKMLKVLGDAPLATGIVGGSAGLFIQQQLDRMGIDHDFVVSDRATRTNLKITDQIRHTTTELNEPGAPVTQELLQLVWEKIDSAAGEGDIVVISGANPPEMADDVLAAWVRMLNAKGVMTVLDTAGEPLRQGIEACPAIIKPNISELSELFGEELHYIRDVIAAARQIVQKGVEKVVVSMGGDGALFITRDQVLRVQGMKVQLESTVGSGDAMLAAIVHYLHQGADWEETVRWGIAAGTANAMCAGSQTPDMDTILELERNVVVEKMM